MISTRVGQRCVSNSWLPPVAQATTAVTRAEARLSLGTDPTGTAGGGAVRESFGQEVTRGTGVQQGVVCVCVA